MLGLPTKAQALILAAGRGERMRPLSDTLPKPLLCVHGKPLIVWHIERLVASGFPRQLINTAWLGDALALALQDGTPYQAQVSYSREGADFGAALETGGGLLRALPRLEAVFWLVAGDVFAPDFAFARADYERFAQRADLAHLWLVPNPSHNRKGDFGINEEGLLLNEPRTHTYSTIALFKASFFARALSLLGAEFASIPPGNPSGVRLALAPLLRVAAAQGWVRASLYRGRWMDVGTPLRLAQLNGNTSLSTPSYPS